MKYILIFGIIIQAMEVYTIYNESATKEILELYSSEMIAKQNHNLLSRIVRSTPDNNKLQNLAINLCASVIRSGNIDNAVSYFKAIEDYSLLPDIIKKSYSSLADAENILKFARGLPYISLLSMSYSVLYEQMNAYNDLNSYQLIMLAFKVKEAMEMPDYYKIDQISKDKMENLKSSLPSNVRHLVWNSRNVCTIKNVNYNEYLYMANDFFDYVALTWIPGNEISNGYWNIVSVDDSGYFLLKNTEKNRYLSTSSNTYDDDRRYIKSFEGGSNDDLKWRLIPKDGYFMMKNHYYDQYLFASSNKYDEGNDNQRRVVYTWRNDDIPSDIESASRWYINCNFKE